MSKGEGCGYIFDRHIVSDDKFLEAGAEWFAQHPIGFQEEGFGGGRDPEICFESSFGGDDGGTDGMSGKEFFEVLGDLPVEEADAVLPCEAEKRAGTGEPWSGGRFDLLEEVGIHQSRGVRDEHFMEEALRQARKAGARGEVPVGAVLVVEGRIITKTHNQVEELKDATAHAEMLAVTAAAGELEDWRLTDATVYVTKEPCPMCAGAMVLSRVKRVVYGVADPRGGAAGGALNLLQFDGLNHKCEVRGGVKSEECRDLLREFFQAKRAESQKSGN